MSTPSTPNIDLNPHDWNEVKRILERYVPQYDVWVFGSRATWKAKAYSDLDLAVITDTKFPLNTLAHLQSAFDESDLTIKVDVVDWAAIGEAFRDIIRKTSVIVQKAQKIIDATKPSDMKMTNYGAFAADYVVERLASLCVPGSGVQTGPFGSQLHQEDYVAVGTPIITVEHLGDNRIIHKDLPRVSDKDRERLSKYQLREGDIVFSRVGSVDRRSLVRKEEDGWLFSGRCLRVRPDNHKIDSTYLSYFFGLPAFKEHIRSIAVGATMPSLNTQLLSGIFVPHPKDLEEQRAIAHVLGTLDDKIELNRRMNETLEAMARALFKSWFVDFEPVRAKVEGRDTGLPKEIADLFPDSFEDSELGEMPKGWRVASLGDVADNIRRNIQPDDIPPSTPYIGLEHMPRRCIALSDWGEPEELESNKHVFKRGEMLFGKLRPYFHKMGVAAVDGVCSTDIVVIASKKPEWFGFTLGHISSVEFVDYTNAGSTGTKMPRTSWHEMARYPVVLPQVNIADRYTGMIQPMVDQIAANIHESRTIAAQRDALLPKLLSGELVIVDAERHVGRAV